MLKDFNHLNYITRVIGEIVLLVHHVKNSEDVLLQIHQSHILLLIKSTSKSVEVVVAEADLVGCKFRSYFAGSSIIDWITVAVLTANVLETVDCSLGSLSATLYWLSEIIRDVKNV